jgi:hypothetical protein
MTQEPDFVTVLPTNNPRLFLVAVMTYQAHEDEYVAKKYSQQALPKVAAASLAQSWAAAIGVEVR